MRATVPGVQIPPSPPIFGFHLIDQGEKDMIDYFPNNYSWSLAISSLGCLGIPASHINRACASLKDVSDPGNPNASERWYQTWTEVATRFERGAEEDLSLGRNFSAANKFHRSAMTFLIANRLISHKDPRQLLSYKKGLETFQKHIIHSGEPVEFLDIPYKNTTLPALFLKSSDSEETPCLVHFDGFDMLKEFNYVNTCSAFKKRGISVLYVDHPGVGGALRLQNLPTFPETEIPAAAAVDYLETRKDVDKNKIGMIAQSLGVYYAPRAVAFEKRLKCCIAWGGIWDFGIRAKQLAEKSGFSEMSEKSGTGSNPSVSNFVEHFLWVFGKDTLEDALEVAKEFKVEGFLDKITVPYLVQHGENDRQVPLESAKKCIEGAINSPKAELKIFTIEDGSCEHCNVDDRAPAVDYMADWAAEVLGGIKSL